MNHITGLIITLNEAHNITDCIQSLQQICEEIIVVDSGSTDDTIRLAQESGAKVVSQHYLGDGPQKNVGIAYAKNKWVFSLDADERITPELAAIINALNLDNTPFEAFEVKRKNYIGERWIKCCHWYPNPLIRLYNTEHTRYSDSRQHAHVPSKNSTLLNGDILHYSYNSIGEMFTKQARSFSSRGAKIIYKSGKRVNAFSPILHGVNMFNLNYFCRGGILGGIDGLSISLAMAMNAYLKYARALEYQRDESVRQKENFDEIW